MIIGRNLACLEIKATKFQHPIRILVDSVFHTEIMNENWNFKVHTQITNANVVNNVGTHTADVPMNWIMHMLQFK